MKPLQHTTPAPIGPTLRQISRWHEHLRELHARLRPHFARPEAHQHALRYLQAILSDIPRKNGSQIAEHARHPPPPPILPFPPEAWRAGPARRQAAHIPEAVRFATKPELGQQMIERAQAAGLPIRWVVADTDLRAQSRPARLPGGPGPGLRGFPSLPSRWSVCRPAPASCSRMWPALPSKHSARGIGSVSPKACVPKASASLTGLACPSCLLGSLTVAIGSWCAAAWTTHTSWPTTWSGRHPRPLCPP